MWIGILFIIGGGLMLPGRIIAPDKGEWHKHMCLKALAVFGLNKA